MNQFAVDKIETAVTFSLSFSTKLHYSSGSWSPELERAISDPYKTGKFFV